MLVQPKRGDLEHEHRDIVFLRDPADTTFVTADATGYQISPRGLSEFLATCVSRAACARNFCRSTRTSTTAAVYGHLLRLSISRTKRSRSPLRSLRSTLNQFRPGDLRIYQVFCCGRRGTRTPDHFLVREALYQLSYAPEGGRILPEAQSVLARV